MVNFYQLFYNTIPATDDWYMNLTYIRISFIKILVRTYERSFCQRLEGILETQVALLEDANIGVSKYDPMNALLPTRQRFSKAISTFAPQGQDLRKIPANYYHKEVALRVATTTRLLRSSMSIHSRYRTVL